MFLLVILCIIAVGYWLFRAKLVIKLEKKEIKTNLETLVLVTFVKRLGLTILLLAICALITGLIVQGMGNRVSSAGFLPFIIIPIFLFISRQIWRIK